MSLLRRLEVCQANWKMLSYCIHRQRPRCSYSRSENCVMLFRRTPPASSHSSVRYRWLLAFPGGVARAHKTRLRQLCPGRASVIFTAAPPVCSQRCGSSGFSTKSLRSCLGLQLYIGCVYHKEPISTWPSWYFVCCMVLRHHTWMMLFVSPTCPVVADFARHHHINCLFHHSGSQPSLDAHFQSQHSSSATHCHLTSNHQRLCFVSLFPIYTVSQKSSHL